MQTIVLQRALNKFGFDAGLEDGVEGPKTRLGAARFQLACNLPGHRLEVDGIPGPKTWAAIEAMGENGQISEHFGVGELRTRTSANGPKNGACWVHRDLLEALERLRAHVGKPLAIVSGFRDEAHNRRVGGASRSQHTYGAANELLKVPGLPPGTRMIAGRAADFNSGYIRLDDAKELRLFGGIGHRGGWVTHVDVRPGSTSNPSVWSYS